MRTSFLSSHQHNPAAVFVLSSIAYTRRLALNDLSLVHSTGSVADSSDSLNFRQLQLIPDLLVS